MNYNDLLSANDIVQLLVGRLNLRLKPRGNSIFFNCPFHDDKTPSFSFSPRHKIFKCFSCQNFNKGRVGNFFDFWSQYKRIKFSEALTEISDLGFFSLEQTPLKLEQKKNDELYSMVELINDIYCFNLATDPGRDVYDYLIKKRKLLPETIRNFRLGCCISSKQLTNLLFSDKKYSDFSHLLVNMWHINEMGEMRDFFFGKRLIFTVFDEDGKIVSWSSRGIIDHVGEGKYVFSPNSPIYKRSNLLYNYHVVKEMPDKEVFVVEGFFDVISLYQKNVKNCLGVLGTSLSNKKLELLKALDKKIILFLDGDSPGKEATISMIRNLTIIHKDFEVVSYKYDSDPDDLCNKLSEESIKEILNHRSNPYEYVLDYFYDKFKIKENPQRSESLVREVALLFRNCGFIHKFLIEKIKKRLIYLEDEELYNFFSIVNNLPVISYRSFWVRLCKDKIKLYEKQLLCLCIANREYWLFLSGRNFVFSVSCLEKEYQKVYIHYISSSLPAYWIFKIRSSSFQNNNLGPINFDNMLYIINWVKDLTFFKKKYEM